MLIAPESAGYERDFPTVWVSLDIPAGTPPTEGEVGRQASRRREPIGGAGCAARRQNRLQVSGLQPLAKRLFLGLGIHPANELRLSDRNLSR